jgi:hypothetical protein
MEVPSGLFYLKPPGAEASSVDAYKLYLHRAGDNLEKQVVLWEVRRIYDRFGIKVPFFRWWKTIQFPRLLAAPLEGLGVDLAEMRPSIKSAKAKAELKASVVPEADLSKLHDEWTVSTHLLLFLLVEWGKNLLYASARSACEGVLKQILQLLFSEDGERLFDEVRRSHSSDSDVECKHVFHGNFCKHQHDAMSRIALCHAGSTEKIIAWLGLLWSSLRVCGRILAMMNRVLRCLASSIDDRCIAKDIAVLQSHPSGISHPRGKKRCRRLDHEGIKHAVDLVKTKQFRSTARVARSSGMKGTTARMLEETTMSNYIWSCRAMFRNVCSLSVVNDDVSVGGEKNQFGVCWSQELGRGAWLTPQVPCPDRSRLVLGREGQDCTSDCVC